MYLSISIFNLNQIKSYLSIIFLAVYCISCNQNKAPKAIQKYIFMGHTYDEESDDSFDPRMYKMDFNIFDEIWLGGDLFNQTDQDQATLDKLNREMHVTKDHVYWAIGNHDCHNSNYALTEKLMSNRVFYSDTHDGITRLVLNTSINVVSIPQLSGRCDLLDQQYEMFQNVLDTISTKSSSHLVILSHQTHWGSLDTSYIRLCHFDDQDYQWSCKEGQHDFETVIYPKLVEVQKRGIQVIWVAGDWGGMSKKYEMVTPEKVIFLACGLLQSYPDGKKKWPTMRQKDKDEFLIFTHNIPEKKLTWEFIVLDEYVNN